MLHSVVFQLDLHGVPSIYGFPAKNGLMATKKPSQSYFPLKIQGFSYLSKVRARGLLDLGNHQNYWKTGPPF